MHINSPYDPEKEARQFSGGIDSSASYLLLGLDGGYVQRSLLKHDTELVIVLDYDIGYLRFLLEHFDYTEVLLDPRLRLIIEDSPRIAAVALLNEYLPQFHGNLLTVSWRPRERMNRSFFEEVRTLLPGVLQHCAIDLSTQKKFGRRWMRNIVANASTASQAATASYTGLKTLTSRRVHVTAAGPSLERSIAALATIPQEDCIVATDTSLPLLVSAGCRPDFIISVDCQSHSYHHFLAGIPHDSALVLDLASPPGLFKFKNPIIPIAGGHPFSQYISRRFFPFLPVDTSGGNVSHAAVSFADSLGADEIVLHGADFCYPEGKLYARGTYLYSCLRTLESRTLSLETMTSRILLERRDLTRQITPGTPVTYGTSLLESYREKLGDFAGSLGTPVIVKEGRELPPPQSLAASKSPLKRAPQGAVKMRSWEDFCRRTLADLKDIEIPYSPVQTLLAKLSTEKRELLYALMPLATFHMNNDHNQSGSQLLAAAVFEARIVMGRTLSRNISDSPVTDK